MPNSRNAEATADSTRYFRPPSSGRRLFTGYAIIAYSGTLSSSKPMNNDAKRSEEHTSELQSLMRISYAVFCLKKKNKNTNTDRDYSDKTTTQNTHTKIIKKHIENT